MSIKPQRIVVTGAGGFVGRALVALLRERGHEVITVARSGVATVTVPDYADAGRLVAAMQGASSVIHLAARAHRGGVDADFEPSVVAARSAANAARASGAGRFVLVSSIGVNGNVTHGHAFTEADAPAPVEPYARSKLLAEQAVQRELSGSATSWTLVRPPLVYGPGAPGNFARLVRAVARGIPLPLAMVHNRRSFVGVRPLAEFLLLAATHPLAANELFLVADAERVCTPDIIRAIAQGLGKRARLWPVPPTLLMGAAALAGRKRAAESLCASLEVDASKAREVLGWRPEQSTLEGIANAVAHWGTE
jgi:nucleoside-diphosphate-sugar epimerase